jgi:short subunit dehydrogenase-like uncharacterized protein
LRKVFDATSVKTASNAKAQNSFTFRRFNMSKEFDIVIHGATGFTGRLVAEYMMARYPNASNMDGIRWAMGGRSAEKLVAVRDEIGAPKDTPLIVTDTTDAASLQQLMARTRLVLTTVGPYQLYGNEMVATCATNGVDYVDLCGEPAWMRQGQRRAHRVLLRLRLRAV